jgi:hypothetical protein
LLGFAVATGCTVRTDGDDAIGEGATGGDSGSGGSSGKGGSGGTGGTTGGSAGKGGTGGSSAGKGGSAGSSDTGGSGGSEAGGGGTSGEETGGTSGAGTGGGGSGGTAGLPSAEDTIPECDPDMGDVLNTPYPGCAPSDPADPDLCEVCIQEQCCEESIACYGFAPGNVCGWGGPDSGDYSGRGEIGCYVQCLYDYVQEYGLCDEDGQDMCIGMCHKDMCGGVIGNQTSELASCIVDSGCTEACYGTPSCE